MTSTGRLGGNYGWPKRFTVIGMCFCAAFICYIDRVNISVAAIVMKDEFGWTETTKGFVLSSFFVGYMLTQAYAGWLTDRFGGRRVLGFAVIWWSAFTILTPYAAAASFAMLIVARIALGLGEAATFPASYGMTARWVPPNERARSISLLISGIPIGTLFALMVTGWIVEEFGWEASFYSFGIVGIVWAAVWFYLIHDDPHKHPTITKDELELIGTTPAEQQKTAFPWRKFMRLPAFWALLINHFCSNVLLYVSLAWLPSYFSDVQGLSITSAGIYSAAPWLCMFVMTNATGWFADKMIEAGRSTTFVRKLMQTVGLLGGGVCLLLLRDASTPMAALLLLCAALGISSCNVSGYGTNHLDIAPKYAGFLLGITNTIGTIPGVVGVALTGWLVDTTGSYDSVFVMVAVINIIGVAVWLKFASGEKLVD